jgi:hypothetical protein
VLKRVENDAQQNAQWLCLCDCGNEKIIRGGSLRQGKIRSCGCLLSEKSKERMTNIATKHGHSDSPLYRVHKSMIERCYSPLSKGFKNYGGRGITVCDEWLNDFMAFYSWAVENGYQEGLEIDRKDNDGNYEPSNCRWVTPLENCQNTRKCIHIEITDLSNGNKCIARTIAEASRITSVGCSTIRRITKGIHTTEKRYSFSII